MKMVRHWYQSVRAHVRLRTIAFVLFAGILTVAVPPPTPGWWAGRHATNSHEKDDYAPLNQGQLKNLAVAAFDELEEKLSGAGGAGGDFTKLIKRWHLLDGNPPTPDNPLSTFRFDAAGHRIPKVTSQTDDYAAVTVGQLKAVAKRVYDRFKDAGYVTEYPWDNSAFPQDDYAMANIGQAKNLFAFDLVTQTFSAYHSPGGDGIAYQWKIRYGLNPNNPNLAKEIAPGEITYLQKYQLGLIPTKADSDDDGNIDGDELKGGSNPKDPASTLGRAAVEVALFSSVTKAEASFGGGAGLGTFHEAPTKPIDDTGGTNVSVDDPENPGQTIVKPDGLDEEKLGRYNSLVALPTERPKSEDESEGAAWIPNFTDLTHEAVDVNGNTFRYGSWTGTYHSLTEDYDQGVRVETGVTVKNDRIASMPTPPLPPQDATPYAGALIAGGEYTFTDLEHGGLGQGTPTTSTAFTVAVRNAWLTIETASLDETKRRLYGLPIPPWNMSPFLSPPPYTATTSAGGEYGNRVAFWIKTENGKPAGADITRAYLKIIKDIPSTQNPTPVPAFQTVQLTIQKGKTSSTVESLIAPEGKTVSVSLPVEFEGLGRIVSGTIDLAPFGGMANKHNIGVKFFSRRLVGELRDYVSFGGVRSLAAAYINESWDDINSQREEDGAGTLQTEATQQNFLFWKAGGDKLGFLYVAPKNSRDFRLSLSLPTEGAFNFDHTTLPSKDVDDAIEEFEKAHAEGIIGGSHSAGNHVARMAASLWGWIRDKVRQVSTKAAAVINGAIRIPCAQARGFFSGVAAGCKGDKDTLAEIKKTFNDPVSAYRGFKSAFSQIKEVVAQVGFKGFFQSIWNEFAKKAEEDLTGSPLISYDPKSTAPDKDAIFWAYTGCYYMGYGAEQVAAIAILTAGGGVAVKIGAEMVKILEKWGAGAKILSAITSVPAKLRAFSRATKTSIYAHILLTTDEATAKILLQGLELLESARAIGATTVEAIKQPLAVLGRVMETLTVNPGGIGMQKVLKRLGPAVNAGSTKLLFKLWEETKDVAAIERFLKRAAQNAEKLEAHGKHTADAVEGFASFYNRLEIPAKPGHLNADNLPGRVEDYHAALKADTAAGAECVRRTQEAALTAPLDLDLRPKLFVKGLEAVHPTLYHYCDHNNLLNKIQRTPDGKLVMEAHHAETGHYVSPEKFDTATDAISKMQLPNNSARYRVKFATNQAKDNLKLPYADGNRNKWLEPICHDVPPGQGGAIQFLLENKQVEIDALEIWDTQLGRSLYPNEVNALFP